MQTIYVFCFSFSILAPENRGRAGLALWLRLPRFFIPWPTWPKPGHKPGSPQLSGRALTPVYPGLAGFLMQGLGKFGPSSPLGEPHRTLCFSQFPSHQNEATRNVSNLPLDVMPAHHRVLAPALGGFKGKAFLSHSDVKQKWGLFTFNIPWCYQICIANFLYFYWDNLPENLGKTNAEECKRSSSGWLASPKNIFAGLKIGTLWLWMWLKIECWQLCFKTWSPAGESPYFSIRLTP